MASFKNATLALVFVLAVSGCLNRGGSAVATDYGVAVNSFEADIAELEGKDRFTLFLEVENTGGSEAKDVVAFLHGIPLGTGDDAFQLTSGRNPQTVSVTLVAPDENAGLQGDIDDASWDLRAPNLPEGVTLTYEPRARLMYRYKTTATTTVTALTSAEYRRLRERGETVPGQTQTIVTKGPVSITINARAPLIISDDTDVMRIIVNANVLTSGSVFDADYGGYKDSGSVPAEVLDKVRMRVFAPGVSATDEECEALNRDVAETMRAGTSLSYSCELKPGSFVGRRDIPVRIELTYNFLTDATASLRVIGSRESAPTGGTGAAPPTGETGTTTTGSCSEIAGESCPSGKTACGASDPGVTGPPSTGKVWCR